MTLQIDLQKLKNKSLIKRSGGINKQVFAYNCGIMYAYWASGLLRIKFQLSISLVSILIVG
jgi:hypothetical protein